MKSTIYTITTVLLAGIFSSLRAEDPAKKNDQVLSFTENKGQVCDQNNNLRPDVLFSGTNNGMLFHLKKNGVSYQLHKVLKWKEHEDKKTNQKSSVPSETGIYRVDINWLNANSNVQIEKGTALEGCSNYYLAHCKDGALNVKSYHNIIYNNIYDRIDLKWYEKNGQLEYDFIVAPNSDYNQIKIEINGAKKLSINEKGELEIETPYGSITEQAPIAYQGNVIVKAKWILESNSKVVSIRLGNYNPALPVIIDPVVRSWGSYYGGTGDDFGRGIAVDASGNSFTTGYTASATSTLIATTGAFQTTYAGGSFDAFVTKFNTGGGRLWGTYVGDIEDDYAMDVDLDGSGNVYIGGYVYYISNLPALATAGTHDNVFSGGRDAFVLKFNTTGARVWGTYFGGTGDDYGLGVAFDASSNLIYLTGQTTTSVSAIIASVGAHQSVLGGGTDAFITNFNITTGLRNWSTYYGGAANDIGQECNLTAAGEVYMCGSTTSSVAISTAGAHQTAFSGVGSLTDGFLVKFSNVGLRQWGTYYGGTSTDIAYAVSVDASNNVFIVGETTSSGNIASAGAYKTTIGATDGFLAKFNATGVRQFGTYVGETAADRLYTCATDASGNIFVGGEAAASAGTLNITPGNFQNTNGGGADSYIAKFSNTGGFLLGTFYGGNGNDYAYGMDVLGSEVFLTGSTTSTMNIVSSGAHQITKGSATDAFISKLRDCAGTFSSSITNTTVCQGQPATIGVGGIGITSYSWNTGATTASISPSPMGTTIYTVTANTATAGCSYQSVFTVSVNLPPIGSVSGNTTICSGNSTTLTATGTGTGTIFYSWNTGPITPTIALSPTTTTTYSVNVYYSATGCGTLIPVTISVTPNPTINIAGSTTICSGGTTTLTASGASSYTWNTGPTTNSIAVSPTITTSYTVNGSTGSCSATRTINVIVNASPNVTLTASTPSICSGSSVGLTATGATTYSWSTGATTSSISVTPTSTIIYTVTGTTAGCTNTKTVNINVTTTPAVNVSTSTPTICTGSTATIMATGALTYSWSTGATTSSVLVSPTVTTSYTVTGSNGNCSNTKTITIVNNTPNLNVSATSTTICSGGTATITAGGATTYSWNTGATTAAINVSPTANTSYTVTGTTGACTTTSMITINVSTAISMNIAASNSVSCSGAPVVLTASGASTYTWSTGPNTTTISVSPLVSTTYTVNGTSGSCNGSTVITIGVGTNPTVSSITSSSLICTLPSQQSATLTASGATTYSWNTGATTAAITVSPGVTTTYTVIGYNAQGCSNSSIITQSVATCTGVDELNALNEISIFPNPSNGEFTVKGVKGIVEIINSIGQTVYTSEINSDELKVTGLASGIYYLRVVNTKGSKKIIINN